MDLNNRKIKILEAIITDYINTGEPVGSRTISKKYPLGISSATIRNEMSDLEEMGLICQPHTSAGRVPSDKGYRLYVDRLMQKSDLPVDEALFLREMITSNISHIDYLMEQTAKALARMTKYATVVTEAKAETDSLKRISFVPLDNRSVLLVKVAKSNKVDNVVIRAKVMPDFDGLNRLTAEINGYISLYGAELNEEGLKTVLKKFAPYKSLVAEAFKEIFRGGRESFDIYTGGVNNILNYPEFADISKAKSIFNVLEQKEVLHKLLKEGGKKDKDDKGVQIIIGGENSLSEMKELSVIKTNYNLGGGNIGFIGIIGPTRMNYSQAVSVLSGMAESINEAIKALTGG